MFKFPFSCRVGKVGHQHILPYGRADLTASAAWATAWPLQQSRLVNKSGQIIAKKGSMFKIRIFLVCFL